MLTFPRHYHVLPCRLQLFDSTRRLKGPVPTIRARTAAPPAVAGPVEVGWIGITKTLGDLTDGFTGLAQRSAREHAKGSVAQGLPTLPFGLESSGQCAGRQSELVCQGFQGWQSTAGSHKVVMEPLTQWPEAVALV